MLNTEWSATLLTKLDLLSRWLTSPSDNFVFFEQCDAESPYPAVQLVDNDWKMAFSWKVPVSVRVDGVDLCRGAGVEEGLIAAFCAYFVFNLAYPPYMKNTLTFLQRTMNIY